MAPIVENMVSRPVSAIAAAARTTWSDHDTGHFSLLRFIPVVTCALLSYTFVKNGLRYEIGFDGYMGYALSMAAASSPALMGKWLALKFGKPAEEAK